MKEQFDFNEFAKERYSVRKFEDKIIEQDLIEKILYAGLIAPTACNLQPFKVIVVNNESGIERLKKCTECHFNTKNAFIILENKNECYKRNYDGKLSSEIDCSIITTHMMLEAHSLGLGSTWVMHFIPEAVICEFNIPDEFNPVAILIVGYPAKDATIYPGHFKSKRIEDIVYYNDYKGKKDE